MKKTKLFLLDRNAVDCIKNANKGVKQTDPNKLALLERLRALDVQGHAISPLLSIIEGEQGRNDTAEEKAACAVTEASALKGFFNHAVVDSAFLHANARVAGQVFTEHREKGWDAREQFLFVACPLLYPSPGKEVRSALERQLIKEARKAGLQPGDPTLMLALAALHGGKAARKVLKPKKLSTYNTLSDIHVISRVGLILAVTKNMKADLSVEVVTMDFGLEGVLECVDRVHESVNQDGELSLQLKYSPLLFEELSEAEAIDLMHRALAEPA